MSGDHVHRQNRENPYAGPERMDQDASLSPVPSQGSKLIWSVLKWTVLGGIILFVIAMMLPAVSRGREAARRTQCKNNLKQISIALTNYRAAYGALPPIYTMDADGKPLHSWRTLILPFCDQQQLYDQIDLSKPWDDPANAEVRLTRVPAYMCPASRRSGIYTNYLASARPGGKFSPDASGSLTSFNGLQAEQLWVIEVEAKKAVHWMSPLDVDDAFVAGLAKTDRMGHPGTHVLLIDGTVQTVESLSPPP